MGLCGTGLLWLLLTIVGAYGENEVIAGAPDERRCWRGPSGGHRGQKTPSSGFVSDGTWGVREGPRTPRGPGQSGGHL